MKQWLSVRKFERRLAAAVVHSPAGLSQHSLLCPACSDVLQYLVPDTLCVAIGVCKPPPATLFDMAEQYLDAFMAHVRSGMTSHAQANGLVTHHVSGSVAKRLAREETV